MPQNTENINKTINFSSVSNFASVCQPAMPQMYFPNSSVTINYNFIQK